MRIYQTNDQPPESTCSNIIRKDLCAAKSCSLPSPSFAPASLTLSSPMNGRGGVKLATIIEQQGCEVRDDSQRVSSGDDVPEGGLVGRVRRPSLSLRLLHSNGRLIGQTWLPTKTNERTEEEAPTKKGGAASAMEEEGRQTLFVFVIVGGSMGVSPSARLPPRVVRSIAIGPLPTSNKRRRR